jgi:hypothetical protein
LLGELVEEMGLVEALFKRYNDRVAVREVQDDIEDVVRAEFWAQEVDAVLDGVEGFEDGGLSEGGSDFAREGFLEDLMVVEGVG